MKRTSTRIATLLSVSALCSATAVGAAAITGTADAATTVHRTTTALTVPAHPVRGTAVTLTATVTPHPSGGTVRFVIAGHTAAGCSAKAVSRSTGRATCRTSFAHAARTAVVAGYSGVRNHYRASSTTRTVAVAAPAAPATTTVVGGVGSCTTTKGALVAVTFAHWSGPIVRGCGTTLTTARGLLTAGGFTITNTQRFPGFICRLGNPLFASGARYPTTSQDACVNPPASSAYWSFWTAAKGVNTWTYSPVGADSDVPANGEVEAWTYGATNTGGTTGTPSFTPNQVRAGLPTGTAATSTLSRARHAALTPRVAAGSPAAADLAAAVGYLTKPGVLVGGNHYEAFPGTADIGLTIDGALGLASAGTADGDLAAMVDYVKSNQNDYTFLSGPDAAFAGGQYVAKVALLAEATGNDPRSFGGVDLVHAMDSLVCTGASGARCAAKGNYAYTSSVFGQAIGVIAQLRADDAGGAASPIAYLESLQTAGGGFPSLIPSTGSAPDVDSTAVAATALSLSGSSAARTAVAKALVWLAHQQKADGGFPGASGTSTNSAALAVQALHLDGSTYAGEITKADGFLAGVQNADGGFDVAEGVNGSDLRASTQAVNGVVGTPFSSVLDDLATRGDAATGADYLVGQLTDGDHYTNSFGPDQGLTADGVFGLLAAGGHQSSVDAMVSYLKNHVDDYADTSGAFGGPYSGSLAKLALVAESTGNDPHSFGGTDLLGILRAHVCTTTATDGTCTAPGDFVSSYSAVSQALGVLALQASPVTADHLAATSPEVVRLHQLQCADGGFTSTLIAPGDKCKSEVDTTGFAVQALATVSGTDEWLGRALTYLQHVQGSSGLFSGAAGENSNSTALASNGLQTLVMALDSVTADPPGARLTTPIVAWQSALSGLASLSVSSGGFGTTSNSTPDLRSSTQAVAAAAQRSLVTLAGARILSLPRAAATAGGGSSTPPGGGTSSAPAGGSSSAAPGSSAPAAPAGSGSAVQAGSTANTGVPTQNLLLWAALLLVLGAALAWIGRRRIAEAAGRHRVGGPVRHR